MMMLETVGRCSNQFREICAAVRLKSTSTVHGHIGRLKKKGLLKRDPSKPRAIEILDEDNEARQMLRAARGPVSEFVRHLVAQLPRLPREPTWEERREELDRQLADLLREELTELRRKEHGD